MHSKEESKHAHDIFVDAPVAVPKEEFHEIVKKRKRITLVINYPLDRDYRFTFKSPNGFTIRQIIGLARKTYRRIYASPSKFGVWGHDIEDLVIENLTVDGGNIRVQVVS